MHIKPTDKAMKTYYDTMATYRQQGVTHELAVRQAFFVLLEATAKPMRWALVAEHTLPNRKRIDGALFDAFKLPRGYWEAKDSSDNLETEITKKIALDYPLINTIFEDTCTGILYQNGQRVMHADLTQPTDLAALLTRFFSYTEPHIEAFQTAVTTFQARIPELAAALLEHIDEEQRTNTAYVTALEKFYALCQVSINSNMSMTAIKEMLVQHLLTERLFRTIFNNPDFTRRNVIAAEIETVIDALTSRSFSRQEFLAQLDYFYLAIEQAAATIRQYAEKQEFLNMVYERFFQGFSQKQADTHGIVYTPQEVVDFMCASVETLLQREFGKSLSSEGVLILDPCVGTGNFMVNILYRLSYSTLRHKYEQELFCNEVMLLPYYIASLNIEHAYYDLMQTYQPFEGISFVDTLDMEREQQTTLFNQHNTMRVERQKQADITVIIGNPPYNVGQINENDNNKNRQYDLVDQRIRETYVKDSKATLNNQVYDMYVRFFRWATDRLKGRDGIVCFVSNNGFLEGIAFDGFRKHLADDFTQIYHFDLKGNARTSGERRQREGGNIFSDQIRVGVGITLLVRNQQQADTHVYYHSVGDYWKAQQKQAYLGRFGSVADVPWQHLAVDAKYSWLTQGLRPEFDTFVPMGTKETKAHKQQPSGTLFWLYSNGIVTARDEWVYDFVQISLAHKMQRFVRNYNYEVFRATQEQPAPEEIDTFINTNRDFLKWTDRLKEALVKGQTITFEQAQIRRSLYRPFCQQYVYFDHLLNQRRYQQHHLFPTPESEDENVAICLTAIGSTKSFHCLVTNCVIDFHFTGDTQCFPFYTYDEDGSNRQENITDWALEQARQRYGSDVSKWDIFHSIYALLHHPDYREKYADNLRRDLPRIPLLGDGATFQTLATLGKQLADLHLHYEQANEYPLQWQKSFNVSWTWRVEKMRLSRNKDAVIVNDALTLVGIPAECFAYRLGSRSALQWVLDQYQVKTDKRSGITSDPNRPHEPEYIVRLVGRIVTVSVETMAIVGQIATVPRTT